MCIFAPSRISKDREGLTRRKNDAEGLKRSAQSNPDAAKAYAALFTAIEREDREPGKADPFEAMTERANLPKGLLPSEQPDGSLLTRLQPMIVRSYPWIASFAAARFSECGKGALFLFSASHIETLLLDSISDGSDGSLELARQYVLVWGVQNAQSSTLSIKVLCSKMADHNIEMTVGKLAATCSQEAFPLVICADPTMEQIPDRVREQRILRQPQCAETEPECHSFAEVLIVTTRFMDYESMLENGAGSQCLLPPSPGSI